MKARVKSYVLCRVPAITGNVEVYIDCWPQQRWEYSTIGDRVRLERHGVVLYLPKEFFEKYWMIVDDSKKNYDLPGQMKMEDFI